MYMPYRLYSGSLSPGQQTLILTKNLSVTPQLLGPETVSKCLKTTLWRLKIENFLGPHTPNDLWSLWFPNSRMHYITLCEHLWNSRCSWCVIILHNQHPSTCCTKQGNASVHIFILLKGKEEDAVIKFSTAPLLQNCDVFQDCGAFFLTCLHAVNKSELNSCHAMEYSSHWWSAMVAHVRGKTNLDSSI